MKPIKHIAAAPKIDKVFTMDLDHPTDTPASQRSEATDQGTPRLKNRNMDQYTGWPSFDSPNSSRFMKLKISDNEHHNDNDDDEDSGLEIYTDSGFCISTRMRREMELEKKMYPGASTWAVDEERLFEILYLRQELPILPSFWEIDFRGIPISERCFSTTEASKPIIYAHCREFRATMALTRLIDLTANVRTVIQCGLPHKAPPMIKKALDSYISWAAQDGSFAHLDVVPNIIAEVIDSGGGEAGVTRIIENRMRALARLQREYLKIRRDVDLLPDVKDGACGKKSWKLGGFRLLDVFFKLFETADSAEESGENVEDEMGINVEKQGLAGRMGDSPTTEPHRNQSSPRRPHKNIKEEDNDNDTHMSDIPHIPAPRTTTATQYLSQYRRRPPVVYGLFILKTSIFIMSVDSSRGESGYVSFHVDVDLKDYKQSVWNALTMAMVVCIARDEMMSRLEDFEAVNPLEESDDDV